MVDEGDQDVLARCPLPYVAVDQRDVRRDRVRASRTWSRRVHRVAEVVAGHDERRAVVLQPVDGVPGVGHPAGVDEDDRAQGAGEEPVPQEPEPLLAGRAEQVQHHLLVEADPAEVEGDRGGGLAADARRLVDADARLGHRLLGVQRPDLADRAHHRGLADAEPADDHDLQTVVARCRPAASRAAGSEVLESNEHLLQDVGNRAAAPRPRRRAGVAGGDPAGVEQVGEQDPHDAHRQCRGRPRSPRPPSGVRHSRRILACSDCMPGVGSDSVTIRVTRSSRVVVGAAAAAGDGVEPVRVLAVDGPAAHADSAAGPPRRARSGTRRAARPVRSCCARSRPTSASSAATTARWAPSPASTMNSSPPWNSVMDCRTPPVPSPNSTDAPCDRLWIPEAMAASWSAWSTLSPADAAQLEAVPGQHEGVPGAGGALQEVLQQPVQVVIGGLHRGRGGPGRGRRRAPASNLLSCRSASVNGARRGRRSAAGAGRGPSCAGRRPARTAARAGAAAVTEGGESRSRCRRAGASAGPSVRAPVRWRGSPAGAAVALGRGTLRVSPAGPARRACGRRRHVRLRAGFGPDARSSSAGGTRAAAGAAAGARAPRPRADGGVACRRPSVQSAPRSAGRVRGRGGGRP